MRCNRWAVAALLLSLFAWSALLSPYYFTTTHDGVHSLFYQLEFLQGVADGQWLPRWGPDFGFGRGYPLFIFYAPLTSYIVQGVKAIGLWGLVGSVKVTWLLGFLVGAAGMFRLAKAWWHDDRAAFIATLVYTYIPYKLVDIYVRGAFAEFWALALFPWVVLGFHRLIHRPTLTNLSHAALWYAALILVHTATALLFSSVIGVLLIAELAFVRWSRPDTPWKKLLTPTLMGGGAVVLGIFNATLFWLPLLGEQRYIDVTQYVPANYNFANQFTEGWQFFSPFWGFDYAVPGPNDGMSFQLGVLPLLLGIITLWLVRQRILKAEMAARLIVLVVSVIIVVLTMTALSYTLWQGFPLAAMVQFPWRALGLSALLLALVAGGAAVGLAQLAPRTQGVHPAIAMVGLLTIVGSLQYATPRFTPPNPREETLGTILDFQRAYPDMAGRLEGSDLVPQSSPMEAQYDAFQDPYKFRSIRGTAAITQTYYGGSTVKARIETDRPARIELMTYDYPGWTLYLNGEKLPHRTLPPEGTIAFDVPAGTFDLTARFEDTPLRQTSVIISGVAFTLSLILLLLKDRPLAEGLARRG